jgi:hypothetical protein
MTFTSTNSSPNIDGHRMGNQEGSARARIAVSRTGVKDASPDAGTCRGGRMRTERTTRTHTSPRVQPGDDTPHSDRGGRQHREHSPQRLHNDQHPLVRREHRTAVAPHADREGIIPAAGKAVARRRRLPSSDVTTGPGLLRTALIIEGVRDPLRFLPSPRNLLVYRCWSTARIPVDAQQSVVVHCGANLGSDLIWRTRTPISASLL